MFTDAYRVSRESFESPYSHRGREMDELSYGSDNQPSLEQIADLEKKCWKSPVLIEVDIANKTTNTLTPGFIDGFGNYASS
jgi:hypothetical protein